MRTRRARRARGETVNKFQKSNRFSGKNREQRGAGSAVVDSGRAVESEGVCKGTLRGARHSRCCTPPPIARSGRGTPETARKRGCGAEWGECDEVCSSKGGWKAAQIVDDVRSREGAVWDLTGWGQSSTTCGRARAAAVSRRRGDEFPQGGAWGYRWRY